MAKIVQVVKPLIDIRNPKSATALLLIASASAILWWNMSYIVQDLRKLATDALGDSGTASFVLIIVAALMYTMAAIILKYRN